MLARDVFEYAMIRIVPRVERGEFINAGVVLLCRQRRFLEARIEFDAARLRALDATADLQAIAAQLEHIPLICVGGEAAGPIGALPLYERFRWLTAPRSTIIQASPVHCGVCEYPEAELERLMRLLVSPPQIESRRSSTHNMTKTDTQLV